MFILGLLVLAASAVAAVELILANRGAMDFNMWNWTWHFDAFWLAVIGAIIVTAAWIGIGLMQIAFAHARRMRREHRALAAENRMLAERAQAAGIEPMPAERPVAERQTDDVPSRTATAVPADGTYDTGQASQHSVESGDRHTDGATEEEHEGFFSRHAMTGRGHRR
jgi:hypothetical protein